MKHELRDQVRKAAAEIMVLFPEAKPDTVPKTGDFGGATFKERTETLMLGAIGTLEEEFETGLGI